MAEIPPHDPHKDIDIPPPAPADIPEPPPRPGEVGPPPQGPDVWPQPPTPEIDPPAAGSISSISTAQPSGVMP